MKKIFTLLAVAALALFTAVSCSKVQPTEITGDTNCSVSLTISGFQQGARLLVKYRIDPGDSYAVREIAAQPAVVVPFHCPANRTLEVQFECYAGSKSGAKNVSLHPGAVLNEQLTLN